MTILIFVGKPGQVLQSLMALIEKHGGDTTLEQIVQWGNEVESDIEL